MCIRDSNNTCSHFDRKRFLETLNFPLSFSLKPIFAVHSYTILQLDTFWYIYVYREYDSSITVMFVTSTLLPITNNIMHTTNCVLTERIIDTTNNIYLLLLYIIKCKQLFIIRSVKHVVYVVDNCKQRIAITIVTRRNFL